MAQPVIGITTSRQQNREGRPVIGAFEPYVQAVIRAGGAALLIPLVLSDEAVEGLLTHLDGMLFTGGGDIHPSFYTSQEHPQVNEVDPQRDRLEISLARQVVDSGMPFLGICRGMQILNVALGGSLYEDLTDQYPGALRHQYSPDWPRDYLAHPVQLQPGSRLVRILATQQIQVNSLHHQGLRQISSRLQVTAHAPDGVVEAVELPEHPFGLAVQWHPECLPEDAAMQALFTHFVAAAQAAPASSSNNKV